MMNWQMVKAAFRNEKGQGMVEYGLILALIAVAAAGAMGLLGTGLSNKLDAVKTAIG